MYLSSKSSQTSRVLTGLASTLGTRLGLLALLECIENLLSALRCQVLLQQASASQNSKNISSTHIEIVSNDQHGSVAACSLALDFNDSELAVLCRLAGFDPTEVLAYSVENLRRAAKHAGSGCADLNEVLADRLPRSCSKAESVDFRVSRRWR